MYKKTLDRADSYDQALVVLGNDKWSEVMLMHLPFDSTVHLTLLLLV